MDADRLPRMLDIPDRLGFAAGVDWLPARVERAHPDGRRVDLRPLRFEPDGSAVQAGLAGRPSGMRLMASPPAACGR